MSPPRPLLASGREADIFEFGPGLVLRRSRAGRSLLGEARIMGYLHDRGYPVPAIDSVSDDGTELVMERIDGESMVAAIGRAPWSVRRQGKVLADLHRRLHEIEPPDFLPSAPVGRAERVVHMDLHPLNVLVGRRGPTVIDWTGAALGEPAVDVGLAWTLMAAGQVPGSRVKSALLGSARSLLVNAFVNQFDRDVVAARLEEIVSWKVEDPHMSQREVAGMWDFARRAGGRSAL